MKLNDQTICQATTNCNAPDCISSGHISPQSSIISFINNSHVFIHHKIGQVSQISNHFILYF